MNMITQALTQAAARHWLAYRRGLRHVRGMSSIPTASLVRLAEHRAVAQSAVRILRTSGWRHRVAANRLFRQLVYSSRA